MPEWCTYIPVLVHWAAIAMAAIGVAFFCFALCMDVEWVTSPIHFI